MQCWRHAKIVDADVCGGARGDKDVTTVADGASINSAEAKSNDMLSLDGLNPVGKAAHALEAGCVHNTTCYLSKTESF